MLREVEEVEGRERSKSAWAEGRDRAQSVAEAVLFGDEQKGVEEEEEDPLQPPVRTDPGCEFLSNPALVVDP